MADNAAGSTRRLRLMAACATLVLAAAACADDAAEGPREDATDAPAATSDAAGDSMLDRIPTFPADEGDVDNSGRPGAGGALQNQAVDPQAPAGGGTPGRPAGPAGSSAREGTGPVGGDDLTSRNATSSATQTDAILARAARAYAGVRTLRADFEQSTENPVLRRTSTSRGTLYQSRPDRFAMRFSQPEGDRIVADGEHIWVYYPSVDADQVIRMTASAGGAGAVDLQAQFLGDPTERFNATHDGVESVGGRRADVLTLTPRGRESYRTLKVWVDQSDALVRRFEITEHNGVIRRFVLRGLTPGADIDPSIFRFTPPEGAHVVARG